MINDELLFLDPVGNIYSHHLLHVYRVIAMVVPKRYSECTIYCRPAALNIPLVVYGLHGI